MFSLAEDNQVKYNKYSREKASTWIWSPSIIPWKVDETIVDPDDPEVEWEEKNDEFESYFSEEKEPKGLSSSSIWNIPMGSCELELDDVSLTLMHRVIVFADYSLG